MRGDLTLDGNRAVAIDGADAAAARWHALLALAAVVLLGASLRLYDLGTLSLWADEAYGWWTTQLDWAVLWDVIPRTDSHPAFYYSLLKLWTGWFGSSEAAMRSLSALASIGVIPLIYLAGRTLGGVPMGLAAALLAATAPIQVTYAQEARPYALISLAAAGILWALAWLLTHPSAASVPWLGWGHGSPADEGERRGARAAWLGLGIAAGLAMWLHDLDILMMAALAAAGLIWLAAAGPARAAILRNGLLAGFVALLVWSPGVLGSLRRTFLYSDDTWLPVPDARIMRRGLAFLFDVPQLRWSWTLLVLGALALVGLVALWRRRGAAVALSLLVLGLLPFALELALSWLSRPVFLERTLLWTSLPFYLALAAGLVLPLGPRAGALATALVAALLLAGTLAYHHTKSKEPWDRIVATVLDEYRPGDLVLVMPEDTMPMVRYYMSRQHREVPFVVLPIVRPPGLPDPAIAFFNQLGAEDLELLRPRLDAAKRVWILARKPDIVDPDDRLPGLLSGDGFERTRAERHYRSYVWLYLFERRTPGPASASP